MTVAMQMFGISMCKGRAPTEPEIDDCVRAAMSAVKKCLDKAPELDKLERDADNARAGRPR